MVRNAAVIAGATFSLTVGVGYALCTLVFWIWPETAANFMNALSHGFDFRKLQGGPALFSFGSFLYALVVMMTWTFGLGAIYGWVQRRIKGGR